MVQISAGYRAELLLQVDPLRLRHTGSHRQTLQEHTSKVSEWKREQITGMSSLSKHVCPNCPRVCEAVYNMRLP